NLTFLRLLIRIVRVEVKETLSTTNILVENVEPIKGRVSTPPQVEITLLSPLNNAYLLLHRPVNILQMITIDHNTSCSSVGTEHRAPPTLDLLHFYPLDSSKHLSFPTPPPLSAHERLVQLCRKAESPHSRKGLCRHHQLDKL